MQLGQLTRVELDDVTFLVKLDWGRYKRMIHDLNKIDSDDGPAQLAFTEGRLLEVVHTIKGMTLEDGTDALSLGQVIGQEEDGDGKMQNITVLDSLPPIFILKLWEKVTSLGNDTGDGAIPPA